MTSDQGDTIIAALTAFQASLDRLEFLVHTGVLGTCVIAGLFGWWLVTVGKNSKRIW